MLAVILGGKSLVRKTFVSSSHVVMYAGGNELSHALALSPIEKGHRCRRMASVETLLSFNALHTSKKAERCKFGSSNGVPLNWDCYTIDIRLV